MAYSPAVMNGELVDTHCHLNFSPLFEDSGGVLGRARARGVTRIIVPAYDLASFSAIESLAAREGVHLAFGLHPWAADEALDIALLEETIVRNRAVAVGEIGLDFKLEAFSKERQLTVFRDQLGLAARLDLPVLIHCRGAFEELLSTLEEFPDLRGVWHAFSRGPELADRAIRTGLYLAFGGAITRPRAKRARRSAQLVPGDRILLETDAPSIGLDGVPPREVEPHHIADIADCLAVLRCKTSQEIAEETTTNAETLFRFNRYEAS